VIELELQERLAVLEREQKSIKETLRAKASRTIRVPIYIPHERLDALERQLERQNDLIEVLREFLSGFGLKFDKLCSDKEMNSLNPHACVVAEAVFGEEDE
jgi:Tfp pilus assembly protein PilO